MNRIALINSLAVAHRERPSASRPQIADGVNGPGTDDQLAAFCAAVDGLRAEYFKVNRLSVAAEYEKPASFMRGKKNARIVLTSAGSRSVYCFVRLDDGAILKSEGWNRAAPQVRGNIANGVANVGPHGAAYLA